MTMCSLKQKPEPLPVYGSKEAVAQNLQEAGCSPETIDRCLGCLDTGNTAELLKRLGSHRQQLLDTVHEREQQIDRLDYLVFQIERCASSVRPDVGRTPMDGPGFTTGGAADTWEGKSNE